MTSRRTVLDASAFDAFDGARARMLRGFLRHASVQGDEVCCAAVTIAEVSRGRARKQRVDVALAQKHGGRRIEIVPTDKLLAQLVGDILHHTGSGSDRIADAHVVAVCAGAETALVLTSDNEDILELAAAVPGTRIVVRHPSKL